MNGTPFELAVLTLFIEAAAKPVDGLACVQLYRDGAWQTLPLDWNQAMRLSDLTGFPLKLVGRQGQQLRMYPEPPLLIAG